MKVILGALADHFAHPMKTYPALLTAAGLLLVAAPSVDAQTTLNWGSKMWSNLVNSQGQTLDSSFTFMIGAFKDNFVPDSSNDPAKNNMSQWLSKWNTFDSTTYNGLFDSFASSVQMLEFGKSSNPLYHTELGLNFQDLNGYLWIRNGTTMEPGTEWMLARASTWVFPKYVCCDTYPVQWSVSDLASGGVTPLYGNQGGVIGPGVFTETGAYNLQTFTFVPEPSSAMLVALTGTWLLLRRRRND